MDELFDLRWPTHAQFWPFCIHKKITFIHVLSFAWRVWAWVGQPNFSPRLPSSTSLLFQVMWDLWSDRLSRCWLKIHCCHCPECDGPTRKDKQIVIPSCSTMPKHARHGFSNFEPHPYAQLSPLILHCAGLTWPSTNEKKGISDETLRQFDQSVCLVYSLQFIDKKHWNVNFK